MTTIWHAIFGYFYLVLTVRVLKRRPGAQMTPFEFVLIFLIGGVIILCTMGDDRSETNSVCAVVTIALMHRLVSYLKTRFPKFGLIVDGTPVALVERGVWHKDLMRRLGLDETDVMAAARVKSVKTLDGIKYAILERNGAISIIKNDS
ncbi:MAG TPA: YetF domain-containing protein [Bryobacteraceae bacterium]|nr:YetF domain-containing protein [Bryobacteraceae bacterium]